MNICDNQINMLLNFFNKYDENNDGSITEDGLRLLLSELEIDENFAPLMLRLLSCSHNISEGCTDNVQNKGITFENFISFFAILLSGDMKQFLNLIFSAIDNDKNGKIGAEELIEFSALIGDSMTEQEAKKILRECSKTNKFHLNNFLLPNDQELSQDNNLRNSCSSHYLNDPEKFNIKRSKSNRNFQNETKNFVMNDINFEQLWKCYS